jgi:hypothetical protein
MDHYLQQNFRLIAHRKKFFGVEVDLVFENAQEMLLVEVKRSQHDDFLPQRLSLNQKKRLKYVFLNLLEETPKDLLFHYVVTSQLEEILVFEDFLF